MHIYIYIDRRSYLCTRYAHMPHQSHGPLARAPLAAVAPTSALLLGRLLTATAGGGDRALCAGVAIPGP